MSMAWIRQNYKVPAKRGGRIIHAGGETPEQGTIRCARNGYLNIQLDSMTEAQPFHPTWEITYLDGEPS